MSTGTWPSKFVGAHILLIEPGPQNGSWDNIPSEWNSIRFDAVDVLFVSPFFVRTNDYSLMLSKPKEGAGDLVKRFEWVIATARTKNPNVKIILEQFYGTCDGGSDYAIIHEWDDRINKYGESVATFIESYYNKKLPAPNGNGEVSGRIDGLDVDVESGTKVPGLPKILAATRLSLDKLGQKLGGVRFSVSICPAWGDYLNASVASSCDYVNMQNYSGGQTNPPSVYYNVMPGLRKEQLAWGFASETPWTSTTGTFQEVKDKAAEVARAEFAGAYTWRINSNNYMYENVFQVWLYNTVHGTTLPNSKPESFVAQFWPTGGRLDKSGESPLFPGMVYI
ncbi:hypothetical protein JX265_008921 [Neoarthrinium moseri]|uniref:Uncharacterized protein n=1 Tax=Neoarthrinium moseri TaxID=1658444 RepID=A0A9P9WGX5_9PEZI|nr:hypothetical protein JX265_008921 [Neoarthrinium moseri]